MRALLLVDYCARRWSPTIEYASTNGSSAVAYFNVHFGA